MDYDIVIAGGGPAGLSIASHLGKHHKVVLIDRRDVPFTTAVWYSYADRVKKYDMQDTVINTCDSILYVAKSVQNIMVDDCVILDSNKVLSKWLSSAKAAGVIIKKASFEYYENITDGVIVHTDEGSIKARLLIDCMGMASPTIEQRKLVNDICTWVLFGRVIKGVKAEKPHQIQFLPLDDDKCTYAGIYPHSKTELEFYAFYMLDNDLGSILDAKPLYEQLLKKYYPKAKIKPGFIGGRIVSGELKSYALDNMIFFGQSGLFDPPGCGMGFNEILLKHEKFCEGILGLMNANRLRKRSLERLSYSLRDPAIFHFQKIMAKFEYYFIKSSGQWEGGVQWLNAMGQDCKYWMRNEFDIAWIKKAVFKLHEIFPFRTLVRMMPEKDYLYIAKHFAHFLGKAIHSESRRELQRYKKELMYPKMMKKLEY